MKNFLLYLCCVMALAVCMQFHFVGYLNAQEKIRILPLRVESLQLSDEDRNALLDDLVKKMKKYPNYEVLESPEKFPSDIAFDIGCVDLDNDCLSKIGAQSKAAQVVYSEVNVTDNRFSVKIILIDSSTGQTLKTVAGEEENRAQVQEFFAKACEKIFGPEPVPQPVKILVSIITDPPDAEIYVGTDFYGLSPTIIRLEPGDYMLKITKVGFKEVLERLKVREGADIQKVLKLEAVAPPPVTEKPVLPKPEERVSKVEEERRFYEKWWFWTVLGAVVAGAGTGAYFLLRDSPTTATGGIVISPDQYFSDKDVTLMKK